MSTEEQSPSEAYLAESFYHRGYIREPNKTRKRKEGRSYKKGYEIRFVACSDDELAEIRQHLQEEGFELARPYNKGTKRVQPVYGKKSMERFKAIYLVW
ncbi:MAG: hypothetical protein U9P42_07405, partial [Candidatus Fermentibacteria bacterium]|nr:hypothetical protein [Candidatus Fermentibacteria bacterium]